ncbi:MAG: hypothetical protein ABIP35_00180, partial [Ginsengibacter sp.]
MKLFTKRLLIIVSMIWCQASAQQLTRYQPDASELLTSYQRAARMDTTVSKNVYNQQMRLRWQKDGVTFTTMVQQKDGAREFLKGNATSKKMEPIFNKE